MTYPRAFSHIGLSVPDLEAAVKFYSEVFGFYVIMPPTIKPARKIITIMLAEALTCFSSMQPPS